ncbi:MAG: hypothetical protein JRJ19_11430 [Deltaproteobacteria bacterium]|nr:hypothetical protein [Deltaproteobacteria bacterium]MBW1872669.1 hypothetical protein [Deltaproteobacteria bacterium]
MAVFQNKILLGLILLLLAGGPAGCEPEDTPGGELIEIKLTLSGKNPSGDGHYFLLVEERSVLKAHGLYDNGQTEDISLSLFWLVDQAGKIEIDCEEDDLVGQRLIVEGISPGLVNITAQTRDTENTLIPCSVTPDGGWSFPDGGQQWPLESNPLVIEVN